jgi:hypothetical protein
MNFDTKVYRFYFTIRTTEAIRGRIYAGSEWFFKIILDHSLQSESGSSASNDEKEDQ